MANIEKQFKREDIREQKIRALVEPSVTIPFHDIPNTVQHMAKYAPQYSYDSHALQAVVDFECIPDSLNIPEWMRSLLYLGVGIYAPSQLPARYTELVLTLASNRQLSFVFADRSIVYGTNLPFSTVFVSPEFAHTCSLNTIFQLMGRAGRVGQSFSSQVVLLDESTRNRVVTQSEQNREAATLREAFVRVTDWRRGF